MVEFFCKQNIAKFLSTLSERSNSIHLLIAQKSLFFLSLLAAFFGFLGEIVNCHFEALFKVPMK